MEQLNLDQLLQWKQQQMLKLTEVENLSEQLAEAAERNDSVSVQMLLSMRGEPLQQAAEVEEYIRSFLLSLPEPEAIRANQLLQGAAAEEAAEEALSAQVGKNRRLLEKCVELDKKLSLQLGGNHSFYRKFRENP